MLLWSPPTMLLRALCPALATLVSSCKKEGMESVRTLGAEKKMPFRSEMSPSETCLSRFTCTRLEDKV